MANTHHHSDQHKPPSSHSKAFAVGIGLNLVFVAVEIVYGLTANSSALLADAGHNASDVLSLVFAWIDPLTSFLVIGVIVWATWSLFTDSLDLALDAVPKQINLESVREFLLGKKGVEDIHDLHIWAMSTTQIALTAHLIMPEGSRDVFISELQEELEHHFGIGHTTLQIEKKKIEGARDSEC